MSKIRNSNVKNSVEVLTGRGENQSQPTMIFHVPFRLNPEATSASGIRPIKMRDAFEALGYRVLEVSGPHSERRDRIKKLREEIRSGLEIDFVYSEAATTPTGLGEKVTPATSLVRDINFLRFCRKSRIPVGLFYRDIYWEFDEYAERVGQPLAALLRWRYRADLRGYRTAVNRLYLPSMRMAEYLPLANQPQSSSLPPGADQIASNFPESNEVALLYVGGTGNYYRMEQALQGVAHAEHASLTICTRQGEWGEAVDRYRGMLHSRVNVVHHSGSELKNLYDNSHIGLLFVEPIEYREFAAPMKLYEYLGHGKPIIATQGTLAGDFVEEHGVGWAIPYRADELSRLLMRISTDTSELRSMTQRAEAVRQDHSWEARAQKVARDLACVND